MMLKASNDVITIARMLADPSYCLLAEDGKEPIVAEDRWIQANVNLIEQFGAETYLRFLLDNLKGAEHDATKIEDAITSIGEEVIASMEGSPETKIVVTNRKKHKA